MSAILISRIIGAVVLGIIGVFTSLPIYNFVQQYVDVLSLSQGVVTGLTAVIFATLGFLITPYITIKPFQGLMKLFKKSSAQSLMSGLIGMTRFRCCQNPSVRYYRSSVCCFLDILARFFSSLGGRISSTLSRI
jgi:hypothetical protein